MTRVLSQLLEAQEPAFSLGLRQLEQASGGSSTDIRLSAELTAGSKRKLQELDMDPHDTTGPELYRSLHEKLKVDEQIFMRAIQGASPKSDNPLAHIATALEGVVVPKNCFALKPAAARKLLKSHAPKRAMKALGYRSLDSMLKHETIGSLYAAAWLTESDLWIKRHLAAYSKLSASDFEVRPLRIEHADTKRWDKLANSVVSAKKHHVMGFKELGMVVLLPLPAQQPALMCLTTAVLTLHAVNAVKAASTFLKLNQVRPHFGALVQEVVLGEPTIGARLLDRAVPWHIVQQYYARLGGGIHAEIFEPHIQLEDLAWHSVERALADIAPELSFWQGTAHMAVLHGERPVSLNITDALLSHCNSLAFDSRIVHHFQLSLMHELMLRYMNHERLEQMVVGQLQAQLATEPALR